MSLGFPGLFLVHIEDMKGAFMQTKINSATKKPRANEKTSILAKAAILSAIAYIVMLIEFPLPFAPAFLKLDFSDIPALIAAFAIHPVVGVLVQLVKNILHFITKTSTGGVGELGNFLVGASFVFVAGYIYRLNRTKKNALIGCIAATIVMTATAAIFNLLVLIPFYASIMPIETIVAMGSAITSKITDVNSLILYGITPFNIFKGVVISGVTMYLYPKIRVLIK